MTYEKAKIIIESEFGDLENEDKGQFDCIASLLINNCIDDDELKEARKEGIKFAVEIMHKHGTAKTFTDRINKELNK